MPVAHRLGLAFALLLLSFLVLVGFAAAALAMAGQADAAALVAGTGLAGLVAGAITWQAARRSDEAWEGAEMEEELETPVATVQAAPSVRQPLRVQSLPVAELPPEYVAAVMKGAQARLAALKAHVDPPGRLH